MSKRPQQAIDIHMHYVTAIPRRPLPAGRALVHNHVRPVKDLGLNGFRAWTQDINDKIEPCDCAWAGVDLRGLPHYRVISTFAKISPEEIEYRRNDR